MAGQLSNLTLVKRMCQRCQSEFETSLMQVKIFGAGIDFTARYCSPCRDILAEENRRAEDAQRAVELAHLRGEWRKVSGIPQLFQMEDFSTFLRIRQPRAYKAAWRYAEGFDFVSKSQKSMILYSPGTRGVGKTHLACAIAHKVIERWAIDPGRKEWDIYCPVHFVTETDLLKRLRASFDKDAQENEDEVLNLYLGKPLLILDDVGVEQPKNPEFLQRTYYQVINGRYERQRPVIVTTNLSLPELRDYIGERTEDRLVQMAAGQAVKMVGPSYRRGTNG